MFEKACKNQSVTFVYGSFPHFVHFSLNTLEIGMIRLPVVHEWTVLSSESCAEKTLAQLTIFLYVNNPLDGTMTDVVHSKHRP